MRYSVLSACWYATASTWWGSSLCCCEWEFLYSAGISVQSVRITSNCAVQPWPVCAHQFVLRGQIKNICTGSFKTRKRHINLGLGKMTLCYLVSRTKACVRCISADLCFHANDLTSGHSFLCVHCSKWAVRRRGLSDVTCNHGGEMEVSRKQSEGNKRKLNGRSMILTQFFLTCSARRLPDLVQFCTDIMCFCWTLERIFLNRSNTVSLL